RTNCNQLAPIPLEDFTQSLDRGDAAADLLQFQELFVIAGVECRLLADAGYKHAVTNDPVQHRVGSGCKSRCVYTRHRWKYRMAVEVFNAFFSKPCDRRSVERVDTVRPQAVNYKDGYQRV